MEGASRASTMLRPPASVERDATHALDDRTPAVGVLLDDHCKLVGWRAGGFITELGEARLKVGRPQRLADLGGQLVDDVLRRLRRREHTEPAVHAVELRQAFLGERR